MALAFQTWTLCIYYGDHCTLLHKRKTAIFANNKKATESLTANEVNGRHCVIKVQHAHTRFFYQYHNRNLSKENETTFQLENEVEGRSKETETSFSPATKDVCIRFKRNSSSPSEEGLNGDTYRNITV